MIRLPLSVFLVAVGLLGAVLAPGTAQAQDTDACIAASEQAIALRKADRLIESRVALATCAALSCPAAVRASCQGRLETTNQAIPSIVFVTKDGAGRDVADVRIVIDGSPYASRNDGFAIPLNPGEHAFTFDTPGQTPVVQHFVLRQGEQNRREIVVLGSAPTLAVTPPPTDAPLAHEGASPWRTTGLVVASIGAASLVGGAIAGGLSLAAHNHYKSECASIPTAGCVAQEQSDERDAALKGDVSTALLVAGGVAAAAGAVMFILAPKNAPVAVGLGAGVLRIQGAF